MPETFIGFKPHHYACRIKTPRYVSRRTLNIANGGTLIIKMLSSNVQLRTEPPYAKRNEHGFSLNLEQNVQSADIIKIIQR